MNVIYLLIGTTVWFLTFPPAAGIPASSLQSSRTCPPLHLSLLSVAVEPPKKSVVSSPVVEYLCVCVKPKTVQITCPVIQVGAGKKAFEDAYLCRVHDTFFCFIVLHLITIAHLKEILNLTNFPIQCSGMRHFLPETVLNLVQRPQVGVAREFIKLKLSQI
jgi:hypothetical protein